MVCNGLGIPVVALIDTNSNPQIIDYPIPGNDDAMKSIGLIAALISDTIMEGRKKFLEYLSREGVGMEAKDVTESSLPQEEPAGAVEQIEEKFIEKQDKEEEKIPKKIRKEGSREGKKSNPRKERT